MIPNSEKRDKKGFAVKANPFLYVMKMYNMHIKNRNKLYAMYKCTKRCV